MNSEVSYQTSGIGADRSGGGVTVNMIPREDGNRFSANGAACTSTVTYTLGPSGRFRRERQNQIDLKLSKTFRLGNFSVLPQVDLYNLTNEDTIFGYDSATYATSTGTNLRPSSVSQGRIVGVGVQVRW